MMFLRLMSKMMSSPETYEDNILYFLVIEVIINTINKLLG